MDDRQKSRAVKTARFTPSPQELHAPNRREGESFGAASFGNEDFEQLIALKLKFATFGSGLRPKDLL